MQTETSFIDTLKNQYKFGGITIRLIFINVAVYIVFALLDTVFRLMGLPPFTDSQFMSFIVLNTDFSTFITRPWTLFTNVFTHIGFFHLLFNMVFLYFIGKTFISMFNAKKLLYTFILGGMTGGLLELISYAVFHHNGEPTNVIGASGGVMALIVAVAFYRPKLSVNLFGRFAVPIIAIAGVFILRDILNLASNDGTAHFAHLGGAIFGIISIQNLHSSKNIITVISTLVERVAGMFNGKKSVKMTSQRGGRNTKNVYSETQNMSDEEYNKRAKEKQVSTDIILDKISKSGYDSLTKKEKEFLFNQSKK